METVTAAPARRDVPPSVVARAKRGDPAAFAALVRHYDRGLRTLAYRLLGDRDRMDDALQDAYVRAYCALPGFRGEAAVGTWLYRIAYNVCLDELRRARAEAAVQLDEGAERRGRHPDPAEAVGERSALAGALAALPPEERAAVLLVDADGFDYAAAGEVIGVPVGTVASRLHRARAALRRALGTPDEGGSE